MKKSLGLVALLLAGIFIFDGCKKGPEDPFLSFKSRKKRVEGYWKVVTYLENNIDSTELVQNYHFQQAITAPLSQCGFYDVTTTITRILKFRFDPDGRYEKDSTWTHRLVVNFEKHPVNQPICDNIDTQDVDVNVLTKGFWMFAGATGDVKNRERMFLTDGEDQYDGRSYDILKCSDKEMKLVFAVSNPDGSVKKIQYNMEAIDADEYQKHTNND